MFRNLLFVCAGNICRSPLAEGLTAHRLAEAGRDLSVGSAGLVARTGASADPLAVLLAAERGFDIAGHRARPIDPDLIRWADLILVMEQAHRQHLLTYTPGAVGKIYLLGHWRGNEIPDPYRKDRSVFEDAYALIEEGVDAWLRRL